MSEAVVYVVELQDGNYYVGTTSNLENTINELKVQPNKNEWIKLHPFVSLHSTYLAKLGYYTEFVTTLKMMQKMGINKVRGYVYKEPKLTTDLEEHLKLIINSDYYPFSNFPGKNTCSKCKSEQHVTAECHFSKGCSRCGRFGHYWDTCFALEDVYGQVIR